MFRKTMSYVYKKIIDKLLSNKHKRFIKNRLTQKQINILKKIIKSRSRTKGVESYDKKLYNLGFTERPLEQLCEIYNDVSNPKLRKEAAFKLARWYANQHDLEGAQKCLELLPAARHLERDKKRLRQIAIIEAECHEKLGNELDNIEMGKSTIESAIKELGPNANLYLTAANFEKNLAERINWINKALELYGLAPISYDPTTVEPSFENLRSGQVKIKDTGNNMPLVSVIVPVYNAQETIGHALKSILAQTWSNLEILVVDDCSTDDTVSVVEDFVQKDARVKLIKAKENRGPYTARNLALDVTEGEYVTTHDADDWSHPEKIEKQVIHLIDNPSVTGNTSQLARTCPDLKFYRGNNKGNIVSKFASSLMFRRKAVIEALGFWDGVRFGADNEYLRRIMKTLGDDALVNLSTGPLTFYRKTDDSLTGCSVFGHPGYYMGARKEYYEAQKYYHDRAASLYYSFPQRVRPFPVPEPMWPEREKVGPTGRRHFDVIMASDFRMLGGSVNSSLEEIKVQKEMGVRTGLIQLDYYKLKPDRVILPQVREQIDGSRAQMLVYGEKVSCDLLIVRYPPVLMEKQRYVPDIAARDVRVIVNQTPLSHYGEDGVVRYDLEKCRLNLLDYFNHPGTWHPIGPQVRQTIYDHHSSQMHSINFSGEDWANIINLAGWRRKARPPVQDKIRIGRHSRDHQVKWSDDPEELLSVYPDSGDFEIHVLGGANTVEQVLGYLPKNWYIKEFGEMDPKEFLAGIDVFVYYTHPHWVESFGRVIIEAMAVGVPVILPPLYKKLFEDAAIYSEPEEVREKVYQLINNDYYYNAQVEKAQSYVEWHFGYTKHAERIQNITGKTYFNRLQKHI